MQLGMIGLGRMGANMVERLMRAGHSCVVYDNHPDVVQQSVAKGAKGTTALPDFIAALSKPRAVSPEDKVLPSLKARISQGDGRWELWSFPEPDHSSPRESLARITSATGLRLVGAELVDTVPGASAP